MAATPKITKSADFDVDFPKYDVSVDGVHIGHVYKGWWRNGGTGWGNSAAATTHRVADTRAAAAAHLVRAAKAGA